MDNKISLLAPDKLIKDLLWNDIKQASKYSHGKLLDIGCGRMPYKPLFLSRITTYVGLDINSSTADVRIDFFKAKIKDKSFNTVLCLQVLEHISEPNKFLEKIHKILKKNGILVITVPFLGSIHEEPNDYYRYTKYGLRHILSKAKFTIISLHEEGNWISAIGQEIIFYLESTCNRYLLKYPKRLLQLLIQLIIRSLSHLPKRFTKINKCPINYIVVARKK